MTDARALETRLYRPRWKTQYLGDSNFETPPLQLITLRFNEELGDLLKGQEMSLLEFQAVIADPEAEATPGISQELADVLVNAGLPQLGRPHYAHVSLRASFHQKEFEGNKSVPFYLGSGEAEITEAFNAAVSEAASQLKKIINE
ncbi:MAG: hypothetical protein ACLPXB_06975 [Thiobacillaceae bacterium]